MEEIHLLLEKGILAPSADNLQPWKFRVGEQRIDLFLDEARVKNFCDAGFLAPYVSAGAVIENIRVAASSLGFEITVQPFPEPRHPFYVASLGFAPSARKTHPHFPILEKRVTNRSFYQPWRKIEPSLYPRLESAVPKEKGFRLLWIKRKEPSYRKLSHLVGKADEMRFENARLHREFFEILRFDPDEVTKTKDGLDVRTLGGGAETKFLLRLMTSWKRLSFLNRFGLSRLFNLYARLQMASSQAAGLLIGPTQKPEDYLRGGEIMERLWHEITCSGLALQPMEAIPIFILNLQLTGGSDFSPAQKGRLEAMKKDFFEIFGIHDEQSLILFFRMGYGPPVRHRSLRRPLESFMKGR